MQLGVDRLLDRLAAGELDPTYFLYGEEPLQLSECGDEVRRQAHNAGIVERLVFDIDSASHWQAVNGETSAMSLFSERRLIEIRLGNRKPDKNGSAVLEAIAKRSSTDDVYLISTGKLDGSARKTAWFKMLEKSTVSVASRDLKAAQLPAWLGRRAARFGKRVSAEAAALIADRVEGNLLAAAQEVEKLCLLVDGESIDERDVLNAVSDSARYDVYQLVDAALGRDLPRALRIARGLREEGTEPVLVIWALGRELRPLANMANSVAEGTSVAAALEQHHIWSSRKGLIGSVLKRLDAAELAEILSYANYIDTVVKGGRSGAPWDDIEILLLRIFGIEGAARLTPNY